MAIEVTFPKIRNNADFDKAFTYQDESNVAIDLTDSELRMMVRAKTNDHKASLDLSTDNGGIVITDAAAGKFQLHIREELLRVLPAGTYQHDLKRSYGSGGNNSEVVWTGTLVIERGITRDE